MLDHDLLSNGHSCWDVDDDSMPHAIACTEHWAFDSLCEWEGQRKVHLCVGDRGDRDASRVPHGRRTLFLGMRSLLSIHPNQLR
jgi:hypothetical protein